MRVCGVLMPSGFGAFSSNVRDGPTRNSAWRMVFQTGFRGEQISIRRKQPEPQLSANAPAAASTQLIPPQGRVGNFERNTYRAGVISWHATSVFDITAGSALATWAAYSTDAAGDAVVLQDAQGAGESMGDSKCLRKGWHRRRPGLTYSWRDTAAEDCGLQSES